MFRQSFVTARCGWWMSAGRITRRNGQRCPRLPGRSAARQAAQAASDRDRVKALERELKEFRRANVIFRKASAYFAQAELARHGKGRSQLLCSQRDLDMVA